MRRILIAVSACALLAGCAPDSGTVTDRKHGTNCSATSPPICSEYWRVLIVDPNHKDKVYTDRQDSGWAKVTEAEYSRCLIGAAWPACKGGAR